MTEEKIVAKMVELYPIAHSFSGPKGMQWPRDIFERHYETQAYKKAEAAQDKMSELTDLWIASGYGTMPDIEDMYRLANPTASCFA